VLFVCLGNSCRSPMAEAIARRNASDVIEASSAGLNPLGFVANMTRRILANNGYPIEDLESKPILRESWDKADLIINMSGQSRQQIFREHDKVEDWVVEDPYGGDTHDYQRVFEHIKSRVETLAERLRRESRGMSAKVAEGKKE
jgi:protein-tyrosine-phosphatase